MRHKLDVVREQIFHEISGLRKAVSSVPAIEYQFRMLFELQCEKYMTGEFDEKNFMTFAETLAGNLRAQNLPPKPPRGKRPDGMGARKEAGAIIKDVFDKAFESVFGAAAAAAPPGRFPGLYVLPGHSRESMLKNLIHE